MRSAFEVADAVQILGVDCAAQPRNVGVAYATGARVHEVAAGLSDPLEPVMDWVDWSRPVLVALDAPLGWPAPMATELAAHRPGEPLVTEPNDFFRRRTDRRIHEAVGKLPLDVGADRIARAAHGALRLLARLRRLSGRRLDVVWSPGEIREEASGGGTIEVYPGGTLKAHGLPFAGYKSAASHQVAKRAELLLRLGALLELPENPVLRDNADALDAAVCVLAALDFLTGACIAPGPDRPRAEKEGWIWVKEPPDRG